MNRESICKSERNIADVLYELAKVPTEGKLFEVNLMKIDRSIFRRRKKDWRQEATRKRINKALKNADMFPEKYGESFYTYIPTKKWNTEKTIYELEQYSNILGGCMCDWVEQALEWAQRISNGETWEEVCNYVDTAKFFRVIIGEDSSHIIVGGSRDLHYGGPATNVFEETYVTFKWHNSVVPLIRISKK